MSNTNQLKQTNFYNFIKYVMPSIITMLLVSFYSAIDSWFLAQYVSTNAMAAINVVLPYSNLIWGIAIMFTCGSCALVGIKLGQGKNDEANKYFTSMFWFLTLFTIIFASVTYYFLDNIILTMCATSALFSDASIYLKAIVISTPILAIKLFLEYYVRLDGKSSYSLLMYFVGFFLNIALDYITICKLDMGVLGASLSTVASIAISALIGIVYFKFYNINLRFVKFKWDSIYYLKSAINGAGEMLTEIGRAHV